MKSVISIGIAAALIGGTAAADAQPTSPVAYYQPTIDITKDPGCGKKLTSKADRVAHNRKLAELYFVNFQEAKSRGRNNGWWKYDCVADGHSRLLGATEPLGTPHVRAPGEASPFKRSGEWTGEQRGYYEVFDNFAPQPNTLVVVPFEEGAYFRMMYAGNAKDDGKQYTIWETNLILVNDNGQITHFEMWNDSIGFDNMTQKIFGKSIIGLGIKGYREAYEGFPKK